MDANTNDYSNQSPVVGDILTSIDLLSASVDALMNDFGDVNYDKSLDVKVLMNSTIDNIAKLQFANNQEVQVVKTALTTKLKPAVEKLKQFYINRKNYLSAEYDVLTMTGQLEQQIAQVEQNTNSQVSQENAQSQSPELPKVRTLFNPATRPNTHASAA